ncbi:MAG TPA: RDD family protein [Bacteroidales bacterium]|nr:RDD family protein [Bacteroidales bacterium]
MEVITNSEPNQFKYAGFWLRFAAYIIDQFVIGVAGFIIAIPIILGIVAFGLNLDGIRHPSDFVTHDGLLMVGGIIGLVMLAIMISVVMKWLYYALMESSKFGGTVGKIAVGIKVVDMEGNSVTFARATGRYFSRIITNMTFLIGYIIAGFTEKKQALHDLVASCLVVKK